MKNEEVRVWGIHTTDGHLFLNNSIIAIGWKNMGDLSLLNPNRDDFKTKYAHTYPVATKQSIATSVGMLYRFVHEIKVGDIVVFPSKFNREINIGRIEGDYYFQQRDDEYVQQRKVKWIKNYPRTTFSQGALYEIGSALSLFTIKTYTDEFLGALDMNFTNNVTIEEEQNIIAATSEEIIETTKDFVLKELSKNYKGYEFEYFVSDLLNAMGYRTEISQKGGDSGVDIKAYKDELPPRIIVQVKSQDADIQETTIQSLKGTMKEGDYGLFITLSNYKKNAQKYLENTPIIKGINGSELVDLVLRYYDILPERHKKLIPLKMVYIPEVEEIKP